MPTWLQKNTWGTAFLYTAISTHSSASLASPPGYFPQSSQTTHSPAHPADFSWGSPGCASWLLLSSLLLPCIQAGIPPCVVEEPELPGPRSPPRLGSSLKSHRQPPQHFISIFHPTQLPPAGLTPEYFMRCLPPSSPSWDWLGPSWILQTAPPRPPQLLPETSPRFHQAGGVTRDAA